MLPSPLVDLTFARLNASSSTIRGSRYLAGAALKYKGTESSVAVHNPRRYDKPLQKRTRLQEGGLKIRPPPTRGPSQAISELAKRVQALEKAAEEHEAILETPGYTEEQLLTIYEDLLSNPAPQEVEEVTLDEQSTEERDAILMAQLAERFKDVEVDQATTSEPLSAMLHRISTQHRPKTTRTEDLSLEPHQRILTNMQRVLSEFNAIEGSTLSPGLLTISEWEALLHTSLRQDDPPSAQLTLDLMQQNGLEVTEERVNMILEHLADRGDAQSLEKVLKHFVPDTTSPQQRHLHIKAYLNSSPSNTFPQAALSVLHKYENQNHPPPMQTYSKVIHHLFTIPTAYSQAQAWDLFSHMRYVAHPDPDVVMYTQMIRACASYFTAGRQAEPERALDLWTEMCVEKRIVPTTGAYNAVILACARSGRKIYVTEAFRLAKQMLDSNRDAYGQSAYIPDLKTFCALLEGAKRIGDLGRVRWILAEIIGDKVYGASGIKVNEEVMMHVFHAYASYQVPFKRSMAKVVEQNEVTKEITQEQPPESSSSSAESSTPVPQSNPKLFTHIPPQTHTEVIREAEILFSRVLEETGIKPDYETLEDAFVPQPKFDEVRTSPKLANAYLSVHFQHNTLENGRQLWNTVFRDLGSEKNVQSYVDAMEKCANSKRGSWREDGVEGGEGERTEALEWAKEIMDEWEKAGLEFASTTHPRAVEKLYAAYIKSLSLTYQVGEALNVVRRFVSRYPASAIRPKSSLNSRNTKAVYDSTRTSLVASRPLVRITSPTEIPDDTIPPLLTFSDVEVLHQRLVDLLTIGGEMGRKGREGIDYLKYVCKSYEWALRVRRDEGIRAKPAKEEGALIEVDEEDEDS